MSLTDFVAPAFLAAGCGLQAAGWAVLRKWRSSAAADAAVILAASGLLCLCAVIVATL